MENEPKTYRKGYTPYILYEVDQPHFFIHGVLIKRTQDKRFSQLGRNATRSKHRARRAC